MRFEPPLPWDEEGYGPLQGRHQGGQQARHESRREARIRRRAQARELRWQHNRFAVPYPTDGPKVTFGVVWFATILAAAFYSPIVVALVASVIAALAGLQVGYAWFPRFGPARGWTAAAGFVAGIGGFLGPFGIVAGCGVAAILLLVYAILYPSPTRIAPELIDVLFRSSLPAGIAAGSLAALSEIELGAVVSLIVLVSAYEAGDFLVGSGSSNAFEGPISGLVALGSVLFILWIVAPAPFTARSVTLFGALAAVSCPLGQIFASALLPRGVAWAPALRRLDSYLVAAPLWLVLLTQTPTADTL
jgi:hypothetical protein